MTQRCVALVPCAGVGSRAGVEGPKQYAHIAGRAMAAHTLDALAGVARIDTTLVVLSHDDARFEQHVPGFRGWVARCGGATRAATVANGLDELLARGVDAQTWVLVHDAARCLVRPEWIDRLIDACIDDAVGGLLAWPVSDTLKHEHDGRVADTIDRSAKWAAQTPQMFRLGLLKEALQRASEVTDDASAVEAMGCAPRLVRGDHANFKVTWPSDFALAERLLRS